MFSSAQYFDILIATAFRKLIRTERLTKRKKVREEKSSEEKRVCVCADVTGEKISTSTPQTTARDRKHRSLWKLTWSDI